MEIDSENLNEDDFFKVVTDYEEETVIDMSNTGLTIVPSTIFKNKQIVELDLSENNVRALPPEIGQLQNLRRLHIGRNGFRCSEPNDFSALPRELTKLTRLEYLGLPECNLSCIPAIVWRIVSLRSLDISRNKIQTLPPSIGNLDKLISINCQHMGLTSLPEEIVGCQSLETILLFGNRIVTLPYVLADMQFLRSISLNLRAMAADIDLSTMALLHSGQIRSDHICNTVYQLTAIESLDLSFCSINHLKQFPSTSSLRELDLRGNFFREVPDPLLALTGLELLDLSANLIRELPDSLLPSSGDARLEACWPRLRLLSLEGNGLEVLSARLFLLPALESLNINHNKLQRLHLDVELQEENPSRLRSLVCCHNMLHEVPRGLSVLGCLEQLDLRHNRIEQLPLELCELSPSLRQMHVYDGGLYRRGCWLLGNPIEFPSRSVWHSTDISQLTGFLERIKLQRMNKKTPMKIVILGNNDEDKDEFLIKLLRVKFTKPTNFLSLTKWISPNHIPFVFVNISSNLIYRLLWKHFIDENSLIWIILNNSDVNDYEKKIKPWIELSVNNSSDSIIQLIYLNNSKNENETETSESIGNENDDSNIQLNKISIQTKEFCDKNGVKMIDNIHKFDCNSNMISFNEFISELEYNSVDKSLFFEDSIYTVLQEMADKIEKYCKMEPVIYLSYEKCVEHLRQTHSISLDTVQKCFSILHRQGRIIWLQKRNHVSMKVYPFVSKFIRAITCLIRNSFHSELDHATNRLLKADALIDGENLEKIKFNFVNYGEMSLPFYKVLTTDLHKSLLAKDFLVDAQVCWTTPLLPVPEESIYTRPYIVFPALNEAQFDVDYFFAEVSTDNSEPVMSGVVLSTDSHGLFVGLSCCLNESALKRWDWKNVAYLVNETGHVLVDGRSRERVFCLSRGFHPKHTFNEWLSYWLTSDLWIGISVLDGGATTLRQHFDTHNLDCP